MDEYEQRYMQPGEQVLFREKVVSRTAFNVAVVFAAVFGLAGLALMALGFASVMPAAMGVGFGAILAAFAAFMGVTGVMFSVFRTMVTTSNVHVHFGWVKRKIPLGAVSAVHAMTLQGLKQGKVSLGVDGVVRTWVGNSVSGRGVEIAYREEGERPNVLTVGSEDADRFVDAVERARTGVRVALDPAEERPRATETEALREESAGAEAAERGLKDRA